LSFAAAAGAHDGCDLAARTAQINAVEHLLSTEAAAQADYLDCRGNFV